MDAAAHLAEAERLIATWEDNTRKITREVRNPADLSYLNRLNDSGVALAQVHALIAIGQLLSRTIAIATEATP